MGLNNGGCCEINQFWIKLRINFQKKEEIKCSVKKPNIQSRSFDFNGAGLFSCVILAALFDVYNNFMGAFCQSFGF